MVTLSHFFNKMTIQRHLLKLVLKRRIFKTWCKRNNNKFLQWNSKQSKTQLTSTSLPRFIYRRYETRAAAFKLGDDHAPLAIARVWWWNLAITSVIKELEAAAQPVQTSSHKKKTKKDKHRRKTDLRMQSTISNHRIYKSRLCQRQSLLYFRCL